MWFIRNSYKTGTALRMTWHQFFRGRRNSLDRWTGKIAKHLARGRQLCSQLSIFEGSLADVVKFKNWRTLAELLRFWCCQVQKLKKSRRIASILTLSRSIIENVSENCFVFDDVSFEKWGSLAELLRFFALITLRSEDVSQNSWFSSLQIDR